MKRQSETRKMDLDPRPDLMHQRAERGHQAQRKAS